MSEGKTRHVPWAWVSCVDPHCGHSRAISMVPWMIRWSVRSPFALMRQNFRCSVCGTRGCVFSPPLVDHSNVEFFPVGHEVRMGGERLTGESYEMRDQRIAAAYSCEWKFA
jgi:hypothetical protein